MARNLLFGYYYCNLEHAHSTEKEVTECNEMGKKGTKEMARNILSGYNYCNLEHAHSSEREVTECNEMEKNRKKRNHDMEKIETENEAKNVQLEQEKIEIEKLKLKQEGRRDKMKHREKMAKLELERMKLEHNTFNATISECPVDSKEIPTHLSLVTRNLVHIHNASEPQACERRFTVCETPVSNYGAVHASEPRESPNHVQPRS